MDNVAGVKIPKFEHVVEGSDGKMALTGLRAGGKAIQVHSRLQHRALRRDSLGLRNPPPGMHTERPLATAGNGLPCRRLVSVISSHHQQSVLRHWHLAGRRQLGAILHTVDQVCRAQCPSQSTAYISHCFVRDRITRTPFGCVPRRRASRTSRR